MARKLFTVAIMTFFEDLRLKVYAAMWVLTFFLMLQLLYEPSSNQMLNRADVHSLLALIINLNVYLLILPSAPIFPQDAGLAATIIQVAVLVMHGFVTAHLAVLLLLGFKQIGKTLVGKFLKRRLAETAGIAIEGGGGQAPRSHCQ